MLGNHLPHICIDARFSGAARTRGIGRYVELLLEGLARSASLPFRVTLLVLPETQIAEAVAERFALEVVSAPWYSFAEQRELPKILRNLQPDLVHFPHLNVPYWYQGRYVVTVHDLILWDRPTLRASGHSPLVFWTKYVLFRMIARAAVERSQGLATVSHYSRHRIQQTFGIPLGKIAVMHPPVAPAIIRHDTKRLSKKSAPYVLYVGSLYPHKNIETLFQAFAIAGQVIPELELVIVGARDRFRDRYEREVSHKPWADKVRWVEAVSDQDLIGWYEGALCYVQPSLDEGFGLPPLEASILGVPVIAARSASLPEILPASVVLVPPLDAEAYAQAIVAYATGAQQTRDPAQYVTTANMAEQMTEFYLKHLDH